MFKFCKIILQNKEHCNLSTIFFIFIHVRQSLYTSCSLHAICLRKNIIYKAAKVIKGKSSNFDKGTENTLKNFQVFIDRNSQHFLKRSELFYY